MRKIKYIRKFELVKNRLISKQLARLLDDYTPYPVVRHMMHNDVSVRCYIALGRNDCDEVVVDVPIDIFNELPIIEVE